MAERTVLLVDDSATVIKHLTRIVESSGRYKVVGTANNGLEALKLHKELKPDVTCLDIVMPGTDGLQALQMILKLDPNAPIVMITSVGGVAEMVNKCLEAGARSVIAKPFDEKKVLEVLDGLH